MNTAVCTEMTHSMVQELSLPNAKKRTSPNEGESMTIRTIAKSESGASEYLPGALLYSLISSHTGLTK